MEKFEIISDEHRGTRKCDFSVLDQQYPLIGKTWFKKSKFSVEAEI